MTKAPHVFSSCLGHQTPDISWLWKGEANLEEYARSFLPSICEEGRCDLLDLEQKLINFRKLGGSFLSLRGCLARRYWPCLRFYNIKAIIISSAIGMNGSNTRIVSRNPKRGRWWSVATRCLYYGRTVPVERCSVISTIKPKPYVSPMV